MHFKTLRKYMAATAICIAAVSFAACSSGAGDSTDAADTDGYIEEESSTYAQLPESSQSRFSTEDMVFGKAVMGMTPEEVMAAVGAPDDDKTPAAESTPERVFTYNGADDTKSTLIFWSVNGSMKLCGVESTDPAKTFTRGTHAGMSAQDVRDKFYRDANCLNANVMSDDNATILGKFLYGSRTLDRLEEQKVKDQIEYGMINYNGNGDMESGGSILEYLSFQPPYKGEFASYSDDYSQLMYYTNAAGNVTRICWYYYPEVQ